MMTRRWIGVLVMGLALLFAGEAMAAKVDLKMTIDEMELQVAPDLKYKVFGFDGQVPGPLIHVKEGDEVTVHVTNNTTLPHTMHWHGLYQHNNWQNDGVPGITQAKGIPPGMTYDYHWVAEKPGTMWYHCHVNANEHTGIRGMWGPIVIDPKHPTELEKKVTKDVIMMLSSWESEAAGKYGTGGGPRDKRDYFSINGRAFPLTQPLRVKHGDFVRVRFIGAGNTMHAMHSHGHDMLVAFKDGGEQLKNPYYVDTQLVIPGSHNDVFINMDNSGRFIFHDHVDYQSTNNGKFPGGVVTVIEYADAPKDDWYVWKDVKYDPNFFYSESLKKGTGLFDHAGFKGIPTKRERRRHHRK